MAPGLENIFLCSSWNCTTGMLLIKLYKNGKNGEVFFCLFYKIFAQTEQMVN